MIFARNPKNFGDKINESLQIVVDKSLKLISDKNLPTQNKNLKMMIERTTKLLKTTSADPPSLSLMKEPTMITESSASSDILVPEKLDDQVVHQIQEENIVSEIIPEEYKKTVEEMKVLDHKVIENNEKATELVDEEDFEVPAEFLKKLHYESPLACIRNDW